MLEAEVRGLKVLKAYRLAPKYTTIALTSPYAKSLWMPHEPPEYRARHGIYLWAMPTVLLDAWQYMCPTHGRDVIAIMRVVPSCDEQLELGPLSNLPHPNYVQFRGADVLYHRNYVAIARAVRIERLIVHPDAPGEVVTLCHQYGVPVHISQHRAIVISCGTVTMLSTTCRIVLSTDGASLRVPGRTVSGLLEDKSLVALVRQAIEQAVAEIRGAIDMRAAIR
ncbi:MAG: hypothetical protein KatS3mg038_1325 [Candidatus Kapaibacterium sp.]|nr:MAG: hypothetical protein KatS3mg038_1325 [Candidatus Kapabacteria bacterium]